MKRTLALFILCIFLSGGCASLEDLTGVGPSTTYSSPTELYNRALSFYQRGQYDRARDLFHEYVGQYQGTPLYRIALYYLAHCYQMTGDKPEALTLFSRVVAQYGEDDFWGEQALERIRQIKDEDASFKKEQ